MTIPSFLCFFSHTVAHKKAADPLSRWIRLTSSNACVKYKTMGKIQRAKGKNMEWFIREKNIIPIASRVCLFSN